MKDLSALELLKSLADGIQNQTNDNSLVQLDNEIQEEIIDDNGGMEIIEDAYLNDIIKEPNDDDLITILEMTNNLSKGLFDNLTDSLDSEFPDIAEEELSDGLDSELSDGLDSELLDGLDSELLDGLDSELPDGLDNELLDGLDSELPDGLDNELLDGLDSEFPDILESDLSDSLESDLSDSLESDLLECLDTELLEHVSERNAKDIINFEILDINKENETDELTLNEEDKFKNCIYYKGMSVEDYLRQNKNYRESFFVEHFYSKDILNKALTAGLILYKRGIYKL